MQVTRAAIYVESTYVYMQEMLHLRIYIKLVNELIMVWRNFGLFVNTSSTFAGIGKALQYSDLCGEFVVSADDF
jgi:hypothetical protein